MTDQSAKPEARGLHIKAEPGGADIALDGTPLPRGMVTGYTIQHDIIGGLPLAVLHTRHPDEASFDGLARVAVGINQSPGDLVAGFLDEVDPVLLDQEALNRSDYGGGEGATARAMLATLKEWARGGKDGLG